MSITILPRDIIYDISSYLSDESLLHMCQLNTYFRCLFDDNFWKRKINRKIDVEDHKKYYYEKCFWYKKIEVSFGKDIFRGIDEDENLKNFHNNLANQLIELNQKNVNPPNYGAILWSCEKNYIELNKYLLSLWCKYKYKNDDNYHLINTVITSRSNSLFLRNISFYS